MSAVDAIVAALKADTTITNLVGTRVADDEIRRSGWESDPTYFDSDGVIMPTLTVDDSGSTRPAFGHRAERAGLVYVWGFAPRTTAGRTTLDDLMERVELLMFGWHLPETGAEVVPAGRLGRTNDDAGAIFDRVSLQINGVLAVSNF